MAAIVKIINKDNSISYKVIVRYKGVFATKRFKVKGGRKATTEADAKAWGRDIEKQIDDGTYKKPEKRKNYTVKEAIEKYIADGNPKKKESTRRNYITSLEWFKKEIGNIPIRNLERSDIRKCRDKLQKKHKEIPIKGGKNKVTDELITNSSINRFLAHFSTFLTHCTLEYEIIESNPMIGAKLKLKENEARKRWLKTLEERLSILNRCFEHNYKLYLCARIALLMAARKFETLNLTWDNVDLENKVIYFIKTKNKQDRTLPIPNILFEELKQYKEQYKEQNKGKDIKYSYLFAGENGKPQESLISNIFLKKIVPNWEYEKMDFHAFRHTYISIGSLLGYNQSIIKRIVGHKISNVTDGYAHADCESLKEPMNTIANYMIYGKR